MSIPYKNNLIPLARALRKNATRQENHLWYDFLCRYPVRFQRQKAIGGYIADFYCHAAKLVVELDGSQHVTEEGMAADQKRTDALEQFGLKVLRLYNNDVDRNFAAVCECIDHAVQDRMKEVLP